MRYLTMHLHTGVDDSKLTLILTLISLLKRCSMFFKKGHLCHILSSSMSQHPSLI